MRSIILASPRIDQWEAFSDALRSEARVDIVPVRSGAEAIAAVQRRPPLAVAVDADLGDLSAVALIRRLLEIDAMIHVALVSGEPEDAFHEATEGLGILMKLSPLPTSAEARRFAERLRRMAGAT